MDSLYLIRRSTDADQTAIAQLDLPDAAKRIGYFGKISIGTLIETSVISLTATDPHHADRILGVVICNDIPQGKQHENLLLTEYLKEYDSLPSSLSTLFLTYFARKKTNVNSNSRNSVFSHLIESIFHSLSALHRILFLVPTECESPVSEASFSSLFSPHHKTWESSFREFEILRTKLLPGVQVRRARVQDHDDLDPIVQAQSKALKDVFGDYFLASIIKEQDESNTSLVTEAFDTGRACGFLSVSREVDIGSLLGNFDHTAFGFIDDVEASHPSPLKFVLYGPSTELRELLCKHLVSACDCVCLAEEDLIDPSHSYKSENNTQSHELDFADLIIKNLARRVQKFDCVERGWILNGLPRTCDQARRMVRHGIIPDAIILVPEESIGMADTQIEVDIATEIINSEFGEDDGKTKPETPLLAISNDLGNISQILANPMKFFHGLSAEVYSSTHELPRKIFRIDTNVTEQELIQEIDESIQFAQQSRDYVHCLRTKRILPPKILVLGAGASEKQIYCDFLKNDFQVVPITVETLLSDSDRANESLGVEAQVYIDAGDAVPDELILQLLLQRINEADCLAQGWLLSGFPQTESQAKAMILSGVVPECVFVLDEPDKQVTHEMQKCVTKDLNASSQYMSGHNLKKKNGTESIATRLETYHRHCDAIVKAFRDPNSQSQVKEVRILRIDCMLALSDNQRLLSKEIMKKSIDIKQTDMQSEPAAVSKSTPSYFAVTMFCMDIKYDCYCYELLAEAFKVFTGSQYAVLTIPHGVQEPHFLHLFSRVSSKPDSEITSSLYVLARDTIVFISTACGRERDENRLELEVKRYKSFASCELENEDYVSSAALVAALLPTQNPFEIARLHQALEMASEDSDIPIEEGPSSILLLITVNSSRCVGYICLTRRNLSEKYNISALKREYDLDPTLLCSKYYRMASIDQLIIRHFVLHSQYSNCARVIVQEAMRTCQKTCFLYPVFSGLDDPNMQEDDISAILLREFPIAAPRRISYQFDSNKEAKSDSIALFLITKRLLSERKSIVNHRIVIVGASDTSISMLQKLLTIPYLHFTNITLVSPLGLELAGWSTARSTFARVSLFTEERVIPFLLDRFINVIKSKVVHIDREDKVVTLENGASVSYNYLILATGLQDGTCASLGYKSRYEKDHIYIPPSVPENVYSLHDTLTARVLTNDITNGLRQENDSMSPIIVYGATWFAIQAIQALLDLGVLGKRIIYVSSILLSSRFDDLKVRTSVQNQFAMHDIRVIEQRRIYGFIMCDNDSGLLRGVRLCDSTAGDKEKTEGLEEIECDRLLCCETNEADYDIFQAIIRAGLVYDGRLVVNACFQTNDAYIYAAGPLARFSRRYSKFKSFEHYNSIEIGQKMSVAIQDRVDSFAKSSEVDRSPSSLRVPIIRMARLLGNKLLLEVSVSNLMNTIHLQNLTTEWPDPLATDKNSNSVERYISLLFSELKYLERFVYYGNEQYVEAHDLQCLVGFHESYLNSAISSHSSGLVTDWLDFFRQKWAIALMYDRFHELQCSIRAYVEQEDTMQSLVQDVLHLYRQNKDMSSVQTTLQERVGRAGDHIDINAKKILEARVLSFISDHRDALDAFFMGKKSAF